MVSLFSFHGTNIHYDILVASLNDRIVKLYQNLSDSNSDVVLYLRIRKFVDALILAQKYTLSEDSKSPKVI